MTAVPRSPAVPPAFAALPAGRLAWAALLYAAFVVYGSLMPFDHRPVAWEEALVRFQRIPYLELGVASRADWVANILLYIPLAFLGTGALAAALRERWLAWPAAVSMGALCAGLAFAVEFMQLQFPPRTVSRNDLIAEAIGAALGALLWLAAGPRLLRLAASARAGGRQALPALLWLYAPAYVALAFFPYDLLVSQGELTAKLLGPARVTWGVAPSCGDPVECAARLGVEVLLVVPLGAWLAMRWPRCGLAGAALAGAALGLGVEAGQVLLASGTTQGVSVLTRAAGAAWGLWLMRALAEAGGLPRVRPRALPLAAAALLYLGLLLWMNGWRGPLEPASVASEKLAATRFLPFYYHYFTTETAAVRSLLGNAGAYAPVGLVVWLWRPAGHAGWGAGLAAALLALLVEVFKLFVPGEKPDPTNVLIALAAGVAVHALLWRLRPPPAPASSPPSRRRRRTAAPAWAALATAAGVVAAGVLLAAPHAEQAADESRLPRLPPGEVLPPVDLPGFRQAHPRLPFPTPAEMARVRAEGQAWLGQMRRLAADEHARSDNLYASAVMEVFEPGSQDLARRHAQLMQLRVQWRGHDEVRPLAVAYDWLHDRWTPVQREQLRGKLAEGCEYLVNVIRQERLSPYNVYLYNAPFQALVACAVALYRDDPRGEPVMRFTHDLWKNRVLPVWRQVMGRHGGWHEGGEYVGIGLGDAIWVVPAIWRTATGEDLFATEPGIRGFLDFLVHRTRPDGTHVRIGDGSFFDKQVPARVPLALEYGHAAAYMLRPPRDVAPTAWPWGPLPRRDLEQPGIAATLPTAAHFDGIGWVTARSDWGPDATYVTFKAGDNYWSHMHLDQGSFTVYKGAALALDSGAGYGTAYGSDHHMNYSYQSVAHNVVTVTDPQDTLPMPARERRRPRLIANDGGQRRIGSGWGVEPAPLDLAEWQSKRETYHTGRIERLERRDGVTLAVADVTAAYTNELSGRGTFSHRTRRVERAWRTFAYDSVDDVVVVWDDVVATRPGFRKRWLLHTPLALRIEGRRFVTQAPGGEGPARAGGRLEGHVLLPKDSTLLPLGGRGFEFLVDGVNYDEGGKLLETLERTAPHRTEPGRWRLEVMPATDTAEDQFLVVLLPRRLEDPAPHRVRLVEDAGRLGAEVSGPKRTVRYWFRPGEHAARVEVIGATPTP